MTTESWIATNVRIGAASAASDSSPPKESRAQPEKEKVLRACESCGSALVARRALDRTPSHSRRLGSCGKSGRGAPIGAPSKDVCGFGYEARRNTYARAVEILEREECREPKAQIASTAVSMVEEGHFQGAPLGVSHGDDLDSGETVNRPSEVSSHCVAGLASKGLVQQRDVVDVDDLSRLRDRRKLPKVDDRFQGRTLSSVGFDACTPLFGGPGPKPRRSLIQLSIYALKLRAQGA